MLYPYLEFCPKMRRYKYENWFSRFLHILRPLLCDAHIELAHILLTQQQGGTKFRQLYE